MTIEPDFKALLTRRKFITLLGSAYGGTLLSGLSNLNLQSPSSAASLKTLPGFDDPRKLVSFPEKSQMWLVTDRAPQLETRLHDFRQDLTANDVFFVRWHLPGIPTSIDLSKFRLSVSGHVHKPLSLSIDDLKRDFTPYSVVAVNQCSGNSRGFCSPRVPGGQWQNGGMGNARWTGVRIKDILQRAGLKAGAVDVTFNGLDVPPVPTVADFVKSLEVEHALDGEVMIAYEMNGAELPLLNGYPLRLVVPGWYGTYWVKMLHEIQVLPDKFSGYWMQKAYLVPKNADGFERPEGLSTDMVPISKLNVRSIFVYPEPGQTVRAGIPCPMEGLAFDEGHGIREVAISLDGGLNWQLTKLDPDLGNYSWRRWRFLWKPPEKGSYSLLLKATNCAGVSQPKQQWNRSGYMCNAIEQVQVTVI